MTEYEGVDMSDFRNKSKDVDLTSLNFTQYRQWDDLTEEERAYYADTSALMEDIKPMEIANPLLVTTDDGTYYVYDPNRKLNQAFDTSVEMKTLPKDKKNGRRKKPI